MPNRKTLLMLLFAALVLAQLYVPLRMILSKEQVLSEGTVYKLRILPVDPYDPFMGRYIVLNFELSDYEEEGRTEVQFDREQEVFVYLYEDAEGFAAIRSVRVLPDGEGDYLRATVEYDYGNRLMLRFPFERYYMTEHAAKAAERAVNRISRDSAYSIYALARVMDGEAVIDGVYVEDERLEEYLDRVGEEEEDRNSPEENFEMRAIEADTAEMIRME